MSKNYKIWVKCAIFAIGIMFFAVAMISLTSITDLAKVLPNDTPLNIKQMVSSTIYIGWVIYMILALLGIFTFIFSFIKNNEIQYANEILLISLAFVFVVSTLILMIMQFSIVGDIKNITIDTEAGEVVTTAIIKAACTGVFEAIIPSFIAFIIAPLFSNIRTNENSIELKDDAELIAFRNMNNTQKCLKEENADEMANRILAEKVKVAEEKLKAIELEQKYKDLSGRLEKIEKKEKVIKNEKK